MNETLHIVSKYNFETEGFIDWKKKLFGHRRLKDNLKKVKGWFKPG